MDSLFKEASETIGLDHNHFNGMDGSMFFNEVVGPGIALFDADGDGDLDVYAVQGHLLPHPNPKLSSDLDNPTIQQDQFFLNDLRCPANHCDPATLRFENVTQQSGLEARGYGMGVAVGDPNGDGLADLYVTNFGPNELWLNQGQAHFAKAPADPSLMAPVWSTSAVFFDLGNDGDDDLYLTNYVKYDIDDPKSCADTTNGNPDYCGPQGFDAEPDQLFVNEAGRLIDRSSDYSISRALGKSLGVVELDANMDGLSDLFVANDLMVNYLWLQRDGSFVESGVTSGLATNSLGNVEASMGIAVGDVDGDGLEDIFSAHLEGETNTLYRNLTNGVFLDISQASMLGAPSMPYTAFGMTFADFDLDGNLDVAIANGAVTVYNDKTRPAISRAMQQPNQFFLGLGGGRFKDASEAAGPDFRAPYTSRGLASGDLDNDGDVDLIITNNNGPLQVLLNQSQQQQPTPWIGLDLVRSSGASALGATARRILDGVPQGPRFRVRRGDSYLSSKDPRLLFPGTTESEFEIHWPNGEVQRIGELDLNRYTRLAEPSANPAL